MWGYPELAGVVLAEAPVVFALLVYLCLYERGRRSIDLHCRGCGYDLIGLGSAGTCPECGLPFSPQTRIELPGRWRWDILPRLLGAFAFEVLFDILLRWPIPWFVTVLAYRLDGWMWSRAVKQAYYELLWPINSLFELVLFFHLLALALLARHIGRRSFWKLAIIPPHIGMLALFLVPFWHGNWSQGMFIAFVWRGNTEIMLASGLLLAMILLSLQAWRHETWKT